MIDADATSSKKFESERRKELLKALESAKEGLRLANKIIERARKDAVELVRRHPHVRPILFPKEVNHGASK